MVGTQIALPGRAALQHAGFVDDLGDVFFLPVGHDMDAGDALHLAQLLDHLDADALALGLLVAGAFEPGDDRVGDMDARDIGAHPARRLGRGQRADAGQDEAALVEAQVAHARP